MKKEVTYPAIMDIANTGKSPLKKRMDKEQPKETSSLPLKSQYRGRIRNAGRSTSR